MCFLIFVSSVFQYDKLEGEFNKMKAINKKKAEELEKSIETRVGAIKKEFENKGRGVHTSNYGLYL